MNNKQYNFIIASIYILYFAFIIHYWQDIPYEKFISYFSEFGFYFCTLMIGLSWVKKVFKDKSIKLPIYQNSSSQESNNNNSNGLRKKDGLFIMVCLLTSHLITLFHPLLILTADLSFVFHLHENIFIFLIGLFVWLSGIWLIKKGGDKKVLITACMILFIHGFYHLLFWSSIEQQMKAFEDTYVTAVENNIMIKECKEFILCAKMNEEQIENFTQHSTDNMPEGSTKILVSNFMSAFGEKIKNSKNALITLTYGDNFTAFINKTYPVIAVYDKHTQLLYLDYHSGEPIAQNHEKIYAKLTGFATAVWISLLILMIFWHNVFVVMRKKQVKQNELNNPLNPIDAQSH